MPIAKIITAVLVRKSDKTKKIQLQHKYKARISAKIFAKTITQNRLLD